MMYIVYKYIHSIAYALCIVHCANAMRIARGVLSNVILFANMCEKAIIVELEY